MPCQAAQGYFFKRYSRGSFKTAMRSSMNASSHRCLWSRFRLSEDPASDILDHFDIIGAPVNIERIMRNIGISVLWANSPWAVRTQVGASVVYVTVSRRLDNDLTRWALAHSLGHILIHAPPIHYDYPIGSAKWSSSKEQDEANKFAAELLIPEWMAHESATMGVRFVARRFKVPYALAKLRIKMLF